jgi:hypothetical protein
VRNPEADHRYGSLRGTVVAVEFDHMEAARRFYESDAFAAARHVRERAAETGLLLVGGIAYPPFVGCAYSGVVGAYADAAIASSRVNRNSVPSRHIRCSTSPMRRARATVARFFPRRPATRNAQAVSQLGRARFSTRPCSASMVTKLSSGAGGAARKAATSANIAGRLALSAKR